MSQLISARTQWQTGPVGVLVTKAGVRRIAGTRRYHVWFSILFFGFFVFAALLAFAFGALSALSVFATLLAFTFGALSALSVLAALLAFTFGALSALSVLAALLAFTFGALSALSVLAALVAFAFGTLSASNIVGALLFAVFFYIAGLWCFCGFVAFATLVAFFTLFGLFAGILRGLRSGSLCHGAKSGHGCSHDKCQKFLHNRL